MARFCGEIVFLVDHPGMRPCLPAWTAKTLLDADWMLPVVCISDEMISVGAVCRQTHVLRCQVLLR